MISSGRTKTYFTANMRARAVFSKGPNWPPPASQARRNSILEPLRGQIPDKTFGERIANPVTDGNIRAHLRKARALLEEAKIDAGK